MKGDDYDSTFERLAAAIGSRRPKDFARALDISVQAVHKALRQKRIPTTWVYKIAQTHHILPHWLQTGAGPRAIDAPQLEEAGETIAMFRATIRARDERIKELEEKLAAVSSDKDARIRELEKQLAATHDRMNDLYALFNEMMRAPTNMLQEPSAIPWGSGKTAQSSPMGQPGQAGHPGPLTGEAPAASSKKDG